MWLKITKWSLFHMQLSFKLSLEIKLPIILFNQCSLYKRFGIRWMIKQGFSLINSCKCLFKIIDYLICINYFLIVPGTILTVKRLKSFWLDFSKRTLVELNLLNCLLIRVKICINKKHNKRNKYNREKKMISRIWHYWYRVAII